MTGRASSQYDIEIIVCGSPRAYASRDMSVSLEWILMKLCSNDARARATKLQCGF